MEGAGATRRNEMQKSPHPHPPDAWSDGKKRGVWMLVFKNL